MKRTFLALMLTLATPAVAAGFERVADKNTFLALISGKSLTNRLYGITLTVTPNGNISGGALGWDVTGAWSWQDGYFCRHMAWGGDPIPYNCQLIEAQGDEIRFTSDRGAGDAASFKLR